jgi:hypothetical protein
LKSKQTRKGFERIPGRHGGECRGVSGDVLGPSGNHSNQEIEEEVILVEKRKREKKWRRMASGRRKREGRRKR